ncbi:hypothetical protein [Gemella cuniculi]|uniref:hypothetical protein n=1 Tax=Gemella cuniculi TaxID=150240 RepID=UPI00040C2149|nr:hypothetical protein [Gemella cuniculi]
MLLLIIYCVMFMFFPIIMAPISIGLMLLQKKYVKIYLLFFVVGISLLALRYIPYPTDDGAYHYQAAYYFSMYNNFIDWIKDMIDGSFLLRYDYQNYPLFAFILYIYSGTGMYSLVSFTVCVLVYFLMLYTVVDVFLKNKFPKLLFILSFLAVFVSINYRASTSGMRYMLVMSILVYLFYKDNNRGFKNDIFLLLYLIPLLIHPASLLYILIRVSYIFLKKITVVNSFGLMITPIIVINVLPDVLEKVGSKYGKMIINKLDIYQSNDEYAEYFHLSHYLAMYMTLFLGIAYIIFYLNNIYKRKNNKYTYFQTLTYYIAILNIPLILYQNLSYRNLFILLPMLILATVMYLSLKEKVNMLQYLMVVILYGLIIVLGIIHNKNFLDFISLLDYSKSDILIKNIWNYFSELPVYR